MKRSPASALVILAGLLFCVPASANECFDLATQADMNICSYQDFQKADKELNDLYQQQLKWLPQQSSKQRLKAAQLAWIKFRDASCLYEAGPQEESGTIWPTEQNSCLSSLTKKRVIELKDYLACHRDGCVH
jgi:uncharacterized protein YecT (DUF1311 family)